MHDEQTPRWQLRHQSFGKALAQLQAACAQDSYSDLERAGLVQMFEFSFELAWKTLKDRLGYEGLEVATPREAVRHGFIAGLLDATDAETLLDALLKRNLLSHTYEEKTAREAQALIKDRYAPALFRLHRALTPEAAA